MMTLDKMPGIDGANPLGFLAAVGVLVTLGGKLGWVPHIGGGWMPALHRDDERPLVETLAECLGVPNLPMNKRGGRPRKGLVHPPVPAGVAISANQPFDDFIRSEKPDAKPPKKVRFASVEDLRRAIAEATNPADVERLVSHGSTTVIHNGALAVTPVRSLIANGQARYLGTLRSIIDEVRLFHLDEAIHGWQYRKGPKTSLDPLTMIANIGMELTELGGVSALGAERLAIEGLRLCSTAPRGRALAMRCFEGYRSLRWCIWPTPLSATAIRMLLSSPALYARPDADGLDAIEEWALASGVDAVYSSELHHPQATLTRLRRPTSLYERLRQPLRAAR